MKGGNNLNPKADPKTTFFLLFVFVTAVAYLIYRDFGRAGDGQRVYTDLPLSPVHTSFYLRPSSKFEVGNPSLDLEISSTSFREESLQLGNHDAFCLEEIRVNDLAVFVDGVTGELAFIVPFLHPKGGQVYSFEQACYPPPLQPGEAFLPANRDERYTVSFIPLNGAHLFPFDQWHNSVAIMAEGGTDLTQSELIAPAVLLDSLVPDWDVKAQLETIAISSEQSEVEAVQLSITLKRPLSVRLITLLLLILLFCFEIGLYFIPDTGTVMEVLAGLILGLWGMQEILLPEGIPTVNLVRSTIMFLYVVLAVIAFARFFIKPSISLSSSKRILTFNDEEE